MVITLAMPRPCGTMSSHRCHCGVLSFQQATIDVATIVIAHDTSVRVYSFPVRRMTLARNEHVDNSIYGWKTYHPANTDPVEMATYHVSVS